MCQHRACARFVGDSLSSRPRPSARRCRGGWCRGRATCCCAATDKDTETERGRERGRNSLAQAQKRLSGRESLPEFLLEFTTEGGLCRVEEAGCKQASLRVDQGRTGVAFFPPGGSIVSDVQRRGFLLLPTGRRTPCTERRACLESARGDFLRFMCSLTTQLQAVVGGVGMPGLLAGGFHKLDGV